MSLHYNALVHKMSRRGRGWMRLVCPKPLSHQDKVTLLHQVLKFKRHRNTPLASILTSISTHSLKVKGNFKLSP